MKFKGKKPSAAKAIEGLTNMQNIARIVVASGKHHAVPKITPSGLVYVPAIGQYLVESGHEATQWRYDMHDSALDMAARVLDMLLRELAPNKPRRGWASQERSRMIVANLHGYRTWEDLPDRDSFAGEVHEHLVREYEEHSESFARCEIAWETTCGELLGEDSPASVRQAIIFLQQENRQLKAELAQNPMVHAMVYEAADRMRRDCFSFVYPFVAEIHNEDAKKMLDLPILEP